MYPLYSSLKIDSFHSRHSDLSKEQVELTTLMMAAFHLWEPVPANCYCAYSLIHMDYWGSNGMEPSVMFLFTDLLFLLYQVSAVKRVDSHREYKTQWIMEGFLDTVVMIWCLFGWQAEDTCNSIRQRPCGHYTAFKVLDLLDVGTVVTTLFFVRSKTLNTLSKVRGNKICIKRILWWSLLFRCLKVVTVDWSRALTRSKVSAGEQI